MIAGLIYNPASEEMFVAEKGKGAFMNEQRIRVAGRKRLADAVIACGLPHIGRGDLVLARKETGAMQEQVAGLRRFGAAALDLAWVAAGRLDGYWERDIKPWDMAAGSFWCARPAALYPIATAATTCSTGATSSPAMRPSRKSCCVS